MRYRRKSKLDELAEALKRSWKWITAAVVLLIPPVVLFLDWYDFRQDLPDKPLVSDAEFEKYLQAQQLLKHHTWLYANPCSKSIGDWLHPRMPWKFDLAQKKELDQWFKERPEEPLNRLDEFATQWARWRRELNTDSVYQLEPFIPLDQHDTAWFDELPQYFDCWDINKVSPRRMLYPFAEKELLPNFAFLLIWGRYRVLYAIRNDEDRRAIGDTLRKWAKILFSAEEIEAAFVGHAFLDLESQLWSGKPSSSTQEGEEKQIFSDRLEPQITEAQTHPILNTAQSGSKISMARAKEPQLNTKDPDLPFSQEELDALATVLRKAPVFHGLWSEPHQMSQLNGEIGRCAALRIGIWGGWIFQKSLQPEFAEQIAVMDSMVDKCRLNLSKRLWDSSSLQYSQNPMLLCRKHPDLLHCSLAEIKGDIPRYMLPLLAQHQLLEMYLYYYSGETFEESK